MQVRSFAATHSRPALMANLPKLHPSFEVLPRTLSIVYGKGTRLPHACQSLLFSSTFAYCNEHFPLGLCCLTSCHCEQQFTTSCRLPVTNAAFVHIFTFQLHPGKAVHLTPCPALTEGECWQMLLAKSPYPTSHEQRFPKQWAEQDSIAIRWETC